MILQIDKYKTGAGYVFIVMVLFFLFRLIDFNGLYGQDSYEYYRYAKEWKEFYLTFKIPSANPWPVGFSALSGLLLIVNDSPEILQLLNLSLWALTCYFVLKMISLLNPAQERINKIFITINILFSPYCLRLSATVMSDILCALMLVLGSYYYLLSKQNEENRKVKYDVLSVIFLVLSISCRYTAAIIVLPFLIGIAYSAIKKTKVKVLVFSVILGMVCLLPEVLVKQNIQSFYTHNWLLEWSPANFFKRTFITNDGTYSNKHPNIFYIFFLFFHYGFGVIYLPFLFRKWAPFLRNMFSKKEHLLILVSTFIYLFFLAGIPFQNIRFLCLVFPFVIILIYSGSHFYVDKIFIVLALIFQIVLCALAFKPFIEYNRTEKIICAELENYSSNTIYTFSIDQAMKIYNPDVKVVNIWTEKLINIRPNSFLLYNESRFESEFKDKNPEINYRFIKEHYTLTKIKSLPQGWNLYAIR